MKLKHIETGIIFLVVAVVALSGCMQNQQNIPPKYSNKIQNFAFNPDTLTVPVGTTVTWANKNSAVHNVIRYTGAFGSENLNQGNSYSFTFTQGGNYPYTYTIHPSMKSTIIVKS